MRRWWRPRLSRTLKDLDDDHTTAAAGAWQRRIWWRNVSDRRWRGHSEQLPSTRDVGLAAGAGEKAVVTDAVEALRKDVEQEAADEFIGAQCHAALSVGAVTAIILVAEGDAVLVERDQPTVRDGDAVGVSRQIGEHRLRTGERWLGVHDPTLLAERRQVTEEGASLDQADVATEELEAT